MNLSLRFCSVLFFLVTETCVASKRFLKVIAAVPMCDIPLFLGPCMKVVLRDGSGQGARVARQSLMSESSTGLLI